jgi:hypothetical protein
MLLGGPSQGLALLAQASGVSLTTTRTEFDLPQTAGHWTLLAVMALATVGIFWFSFRDARKLHPLLRIWLLALRITVIVGLFIIALNPQTRTQRESSLPSQVILALDTSLSMEQPEVDPRLEPGGRTRWEAVLELLQEGGLIDELQSNHVVDVYTFDSDLGETRYRFATRFVPVAEGMEVSTETSEQSDLIADPSTVDWQTLLAPRGVSTRIGDSLDTLLAEGKGRTLSGIAVITDGASNAGRGVDAPNERAIRDDVTLVAIGVGSTVEPVNLQVAKMVVPQDVALQDSFDITALVQSQGLEGTNLSRDVTVTLLERHEGEEQPTETASKLVTLAEDGIPVDVEFPIIPEAAGEVEYTIEVSGNGVTETMTDDNSLARRVNIFDRPVQLLMIAGGPGRDYQFVRNMLHRHSGFDVDVWLQTGVVGISQDSRNLLFDFPSTRTDLYAYDAIIAFDADFAQLTPEEQEILRDWVFQEGGGLLMCAGDVYTKTLAVAMGEDQKAIRDICPVVLQPMGTRVTGGAADQAWPLGLTDEGNIADFLRLSNDPIESARVWTDFKGVFASYPIQARKAGCTVYIEFTDPFSRGNAGQPALLSGQRYGQGNSFFLGTSEIWRIRSLSEDYYNEFWTNLVRKVSEGRSRRGQQRAMFILEGREVTLGQTVPVRARVLSPTSEPLEQDEITIEVFQPSGRPVTPQVVLRREEGRPAEFVGSFRASEAGVWQLQLFAEGLTDPVVEEIRVLNPPLELANLRQDVTALNELVDGTGGRYLTLEEAPAVLPDLFENKTQYITIDEQLQELWDRQWVLYLLVTLLGLEWLTRKLVKLA